MWEIVDENPKSLDQPKLVITFFWGSQMSIIPTDVTFAFVGLIANYQNDILTFDCLRDSKAIYPAQATIASTNSWVRTAS